MEGSVRSLDQGLGVGASAVQQTPVSRKVKAVNCKGRWAAPAAHGGYGGYGPMILLAVGPVFTWQAGSRVLLDVNAYCSTLK
jgi:hypothetical protein